MIDILGKKYKVKFVKDLYDDDHTIGELLTRYNIIRIEKDTTREIKEETILHEVIHAINIDCGLKFTETQISTLSCTLYTVMKENWNLKIKVE